MELNWLKEEDNGVVLTIKVVPRARNTGIAGTDGEWLRVQLRAPPVDGKANEALLRWLAETLGVAKGAVELVTDPATGRTSSRLLPRFDTITYRELSDRVKAVSAASCCALSTTRAVTSEESACPAYAPAHAPSRHASATPASEMTMT